MLSNPKDTVSAASHAPAESGPRWATSRRATREWSPDAKVSLRSVFRAMRQRARKADRA